MVLGRIRGIVFHRYWIVRVDELSDFVVHWETIPASTAKLEIIDIYL